MDPPEHQCIQCGRCCKHFSFFSHMNGEEWKRVYQHVMNDCGGMLHVKYLDEETGRFIARKYEPVLEDFEGSTKRWPFKKDGKEFIQCPFFTFDYKNAVYYCTIQEIKPNTCMEFFCSASERYGRVPEYCESCWIEGFDSSELPERLQDGSKPCELRMGCKDFTHRIRFFLAYQKDCQEDGGCRKHGKYLLDLVKINMDAFSNELKERGMEQELVELALAELETLKNALEDTL